MRFFSWPHENVMRVRLSKTKFEVQIRATARGYLLSPTALTGKNSEHPSRLGLSGPPRSWVLGTMALHTARM